MKDSIQLDAEEQEILDAFDNDTLVPVADLDQTRKAHQAYAAETFKKDKRITIRLSSHDLELLRKKAIIEGLPYQTLVSSILHKYVTGQLAEAARPY